MKVSKFEFVLHTLNSFFLPEFKGSTFRGRFGHTLKQTICVMRGQRCESCPLQITCPYIYLFQTRSQRQEDTVRPFVLEPPLTRKRFYLKNEVIYLNLILVEKAIEYLPYFVYCFQRMGQEGIGRERGKYYLEEVRAFDVNGKKQSIFCGDQRELSNEFPRIELDHFRAHFLPQITLHFLTPTAIKENGKILQQLPFPALIKAILRRYHRLRYNHGDGQRETFEIDWEAAAQIGVVYQDLTRQYFRRYSNRQGRPVPVEGFVGKVVFRGNLTPFYPWLKIGEYLHVGKGATFGLGWYRVLE